jgi:hypothetical protein
LKAAEAKLSRYSLPLGSQERDPRKGVSKELPINRVQDEDEHRRTPLFDGDQAALSVFPAGFAGPIKRLRSRESVAA